MAVAHIPNVPDGRHGIYSLLFSKYSKAKIASDLESLVPSRPKYLLSMCAIPHAGSERQKRTKAEGPRLD